MQYLCQTWCGPQVSSLRTEDEEGLKHIKSRVYNNSLKGNKMLKTYNTYWRRSKKKPKVGVARGGGSPTHWALSLSSCVQLPGTVRGSAANSPIPTITVTRHSTVSRKTPVTFDPSPWSVWPAVTPQRQSLSSCPCPSPWTILGVLGCVPIQGLRALKCMSSVFEGYSDRCSLRRTHPQ